MFFSNWSVLVRTIVIGIIAYLGLVAFLRISGKRTLSRMDPFDFVITTALGSTLADTVLIKDIALAQGLIAFAVLIGLQLIVIWLSWHSSTVRHLVKPEPTLLYYRGQYLRTVMRREHVPEIEILAAIRQQGIAAIEKVEAVVLEADSSFSVISYSDNKSESALADVGRE